ILFALSSAVLVKEYGVYARHSGIPEIKTVLGGFVIRRFLGLWTLITKSLGLILAVASGLWLGKEGPLVHVACCCANLFTKLFPSINTNEARKREVLSAAAASGISVAFGSPIGGVLFSLEQLSYYFPDKTMWQSFVCAMTAAMVLQAFDPFRSGKLVMYQVTYTSSWHGFELIPFAILGVLGGIYGGLFIKANMAVARWRKSTPWLPGPVVQVVLVAALTALVNYPNRYMRSQNSDLVTNLFSECSQLLDDQFGLCTTGAASAANILLLLLAALLSFGLAAITFGLQIPAGIILPSMAIGALTGRAIGIIVEIWQTNHPRFLAFHTCEPDIPCIIPGTYAIIGAAAALAGVTRMTVSIVVIMFELTGALTYVLPIMVAVMISKWVGDAFSRRGIYESWIHFNEYPFLDLSEETTPIPDIPAGQIMTRIEDLVVLTATGHTIASLRAVLDAHPHRGFPVVSDPRDAILLGYISRAELAYTLHAATQPPRSLPPETTEAVFTDPLTTTTVTTPGVGATAAAGIGVGGTATTLDLRPWMDQTPLTLPSAARLHLAVSYFQRLGVRYVLFVDRGVLQGLLTKKDVWYVLNGAEETRRSEGGGAGGFVGGVGGVGGGSGE
ncbi:chloride channel protein 5, partial [Dichotomopilus funicola]